MVTELVVSGGAYTEQLAFMSMPGPTELVIILVIALIIFGGGKLAGVGKSLGTAINEFKAAVKGGDEEDNGTSNTETGPKAE